MTVETGQTLQMALDAFERGEYFSYRAAAKAFGVSKDTLTRRAAGGITKQDWPVLRPVQEDLGFSTWKKQAVRRSVSLQALCQRRLEAQIQSVTTGSQGS